MSIDKQIKKIWSYYDNLEYGNALSVCNKILNKYPYFEDVLEIKAYIFYINGDLENSINCWEINLQENNNASAKFCLENLNNYRNLKSLYEEALIDMKNKKLNSALDKLITCSHSDFNKIPVGNAIEKCNLLKIGLSPKDITLEENLNSYNKKSKLNLIYNIKSNIKCITKSLKIKLSLN